MGLTNSRTTVEVRHPFNAYIDARLDLAPGPDLRFKSGAQERSDIVIGADGMRSNKHPWYTGQKRRSIAI